MHTELMARDEEEERLKFAMAARLQEMCDAIRLDDQELTEGDIALQLGVAPGTFSSYITGERRPPFRVLVAARREFGVSPEWLMMGEARFNDGMFEVKRRKLLRGPPPKPQRGKRRSEPEWAPEPQIGSHARFLSQPLPL